MGLDSKVRPFWDGFNEASRKIFDLFIIVDKRDDNTLLKVKVKTRDAGEIGEEPRNLRESIMNIAYDNDYVISKGPKALVFFSADDLLNLPNDDVNGKGKEDHRKGTSLSNPREDIRAIEGFPGNFDEVKVIFVELPKSIDKSFVEAKDRKAIPKVVMRKRRKGRRKVEEKAGSK